MSPLRAGVVMKLWSRGWSGCGAGGGKHGIGAAVRVCTDQRPLTPKGGMLPAPWPHSFQHKEKTGQETTISGEPEVFFT